MSEEHQHQRLSERLAHLEERIVSIETRMLDRIIAIERKFRDYVTKEAHMPVRIAMFGFIALICAGMITAIIAQVIRK